MYYIHAHEHSSVLTLVSEDNRCWNFLKDDPEHPTELLYSTKILDSGKGWTRDSSIKERLYTLDEYRDLFPEHFI